jgi:hypothetical protein
MRHNPPRPPTAEQQQFLDSEEHDYTVSLIAFAFARLMTMRPIAHGVVKATSDGTLHATVYGRIPVNAIEAWCDRRGFEADVTDFVVDVVMIVDMRTLQRQRH